MLYCRRVTKACSVWNAINNLPPDWRTAAFYARAGAFCLKPAFKTNVSFLQQDVRMSISQSGFDLICCRNPALTQFQVLLERLCCFGNP